MQRDISVYPQATSIHVEASTGYRRLTSLWSTIISSKVTKALLATSLSAIHSTKETLRDLNTEQVLLLTLIHSLVKKDIAACYALIEISSKVESLKSPYLRIWLQDEYAFSCNEIRTALSFAAELTKNGLPFPDLILTILENLYFLYCSPKRKSPNTSDLSPLSELDESPLSSFINEGSPTTELLSEPNKPKDSSAVEKLSSSTTKVLAQPNKPKDSSDLQKLSSSTTKVIAQPNKPENFSDLQKQNLNDQSSEKTVMSDVTSKLPSSNPYPKPVYLQDVSSLKYTGTLSKQVIGEYKNCEKLALEKELLPPSPKVIQSPLPNWTDMDATIPLPSPDKNTRYSKISANFVYHEITESNMIDITKLAAEADSINEKTGDTALHLAVLKNNLKAVIALIQRGAKVDAKNKADITPLQIAVEREHLPIIKVLWEAGANINQTNLKKESLLHLAAASAGIETIDLLIDLGVEPNTVDIRNQTPLFMAAKKGYIVVMEKLEEDGADLHLTDTFGRSLLHYASWHGQTEAVDWLLRNGLGINAITKHGWTPLHWAVANRQVETVHLLLQRGAVVNAQDIAGRTPLYWAMEAGNLALIDLLRSFNANC